MSELKSFEILGQLTLDEGKGGLARAVVSTPWSRAEIYLHGAHVTAFQKNGEPPLLFLSEAAEFAPGRPIRGGVPVIFPWFGPRDPLPAHGFARSTAWDLVETSALESGAVSLRLRLPGTDACVVEFLVTVGETLDMELSIRNTGSAEATFETCLHTYFQISAIDAISISGLGACVFHDKVAAITTTEVEEPLRIAGEVDRVYPGSTAALEIHDPGFRRTIHVGKSGSSSTVVWNPWIEKSSRLPDFGNEEYLQMVCVESGNIGDDAIVLPPGELAVLTVTLASKTAE